MVEIKQYFQCRIFQTNALLDMNFIFIIWQSQSRANPSALIGSFSVGIFQYGPFPRKRSKPCIFVLEQSRQIHNLKQIYLKSQLRKKMRILSSFTAKLSEKAKD